MSIFDRIRRIIKANINSLLDQAEPAENELEAKIKELQETLQEGRESAAAYGATFRRLQNEMAELEEKQGALETDAEQAIKGGKATQAMFSLAIQDDETGDRSAMVKEVQTHPVSGQLMHVDFYEIAMDRKIWVNVPVVTTGKAPGVEAGSLLQFVRRELEVLCLPREVPEAIEIDISALEIGDSIHVDEVALPANIEVPTEVNFTVLTILSPKAEEEPEALEEEEEEAVEAEAPEGAEAEPEA